MDKSIKNTSQDLDYRSRNDGKKGSGGLFFEAPEAMHTSDSKSSLEKIAFAPDLLNDALITDETTLLSNINGITSEFSPSLTENNFEQQQSIESPQKNSIKYPKAARLLKTLLEKKNSEEAIILAQSTLKPKDFPDHNQLQQFVQTQRNKPQQRIRTITAPAEQSSNLDNNNPFKNDLSKRKQESSPHGTHTAHFAQQELLEDMVEMLLVGADDGNGHEIHLLFKNEILDGLQLRLQQQQQGLFAHFIVTDAGEKRRLLGEIDHLVVKLKSKGLKVSGYRIEVRQS